MSRAFLDTHVAYWLALKPSELPDQVVEKINGYQSVVLSSISIAELEIKSVLGKLQIVEELTEKLVEAGIIIEDYRADSAFALSRFPALIKHDPFDRMIFAHAASKPNTTFFTADAVLLSLNLDWVFDAGHR